MYDDSSFADFVLALKNEWIRVRVCVCAQGDSHQHRLLCEPDKKLGASLLASMTNQSRGGRTLTLR